MSGRNENQGGGGAGGDLSRFAHALIAFMLVFRLVYAALTPLVPDEAYYWQWSRHLALSYYDQGPGQALCVRLGTLLFGDTSLGVRFVGACLGAGTGWLAFLTARRWLGDRAALLTVIFLSVAPLLLVGGIVATYDGPQVFFWTAALYAVTRTVQENRPAGWYVVGLCVGLGALCKLTMWLFAPCVLLFLLLSPLYRRHLTTPHPYLAFLLSVAVFSPVIVWSLQNGWTTIQHAQSLTGRGGNGFSLRFFGDFMGGQALVVGPLLWLAELWAIVALGVGRWDTPLSPGCLPCAFPPSEGEKGEPEKVSLPAIRSPFSPSEGGKAHGRQPGDRGVAPAARRLFLLAFTLPVLLVCLFIAVKSRMEANWPAPLHIVGLMATAGLFAAAWEKRGARIYAIVAAALSATMALILLFPTALTSLGVRVSADMGQKANENYGWPEIMRPVQAAREKLAAEGKPVFLAGINYRVPSLLAFYLPDHPQTHELYFATRRDQYMFWTNPQILLGQNAVLCLDADKPESLELARRRFASIEPLPEITLTRPGFLGPVKTWRIYLCRNFKGYDPAAYWDGY